MNFSSLNFVNEARIKLFTWTLKLWNEQILANQNIRKSNQYSVLNHYQWLSFTQFVEIQDVSKALNQFSFCVSIGNQTRDWRATGQCHPFPVSLLATWNGRWWRKWTPASPWLCSSVIIRVGHWLVRGYESATAIVNKTFPSFLFNRCTSTARDPRRCPRPCERRRLGKDWGGGLGKDWKSKRTLHCVVKDLILLGNKF